MQIKLVIGDWSGDGHEKTVDFIVDTNCSEEQLEEAYKKGVEVCGIDLTRNFCEEYEEDFLTEHEYKDFKELNLFDEDTKYFEWNNKYYVTKRDFAKIWMTIAQRGNPLLDYKFVSDEFPEINIGGYGLFQ